MSKKLNAFHINLVFVCLLAVILAAVGIGVFSLPRDSFSEEENRSLAQAPNFSLHSLLSGKYFEGLSAFYSDHIPMRTQMIRAKAICEQLLLKRQNNGVIFGEGGYLIDRCEYDGYKIFNSNLPAIKKLISKGASCFTVPRCVDILTDSADSERLLELAARVGLYTSQLVDLLKNEWKNGGEVYYKTDHHLDSDGAYALYRHITLSLGYLPYEKQDFELTQVSDAFLGTVFSRCGLTATEADTVTLYRYEGDESIRARCEDADCSLSSLYCFDKLAQKDKYQIFLGGNHGVLRIGEHNGEKPSLLVIKDSFANAVIPLLARHFDLTVIDPRYADIFDSGLADERFDIVIILLGLDTVMTTRLSGLN